MENIREGLRHLGGLARRFQVKETVKGITVVDDYGHHPTEIMATLETARGCWPNKRLIVVFQPHRYSRTRLLYERFVTSFNDADVLVLAPLYSAGEAPIEGVSAECLYQGIKEHGHKEVILCKGHRDILDILLPSIREGDVVITLGAGDIYQVGEELLKRLKAGDGGRRPRSKDS